MVRFFKIAFTLSENIHPTNIKTSKVIMFKKYNLHHRFMGFNVTLAILYFSTYYYYYSLQTEAPSDIIPLQTDQ